MPVITTDILLEGVRRDDVLDWLAVPENHARIVQGAFTEVKPVGPGVYTLSFKAGPLPRAFEYRFDHVDQEHGGRRVHVKTVGKRVEGSIHYSLRTMKPSTNTLVTLHHDFSSGSVLGAVLEQVGLRAGLEAAWKACLENLKRELARG
jgi:hypothetical protein